MSYENHFSLNLVAGATAFGDGSHPSTQGAMAALDSLKSLQGFEKALDLGCGSGVLALSIAYHWHIPVIASDIEKDAVSATLDNAAANDLAPLVTAVQADGTHHPIIKQNSPYDLICCNILAEWLVPHAHDIAALAQDETIIILSGILQHRAGEVIEVYQSVGLTLLQKFVVNGWVTLMLQKK